MTATPETRSRILRNDRKNYVYCTISFDEKLVGQMRTQCLIVLNVTRSQFRFSFGFSCKSHIKRINRKSINYDDDRFKTIGFTVHHVPWVTNALRYNTVHDSGSRLFTNLGLIELCSLSSIRYCVQTSIYKTGYKHFPI